MAFIGSACSSATDNPSRPKPLFPRQRRVNRAFWDKVKDLPTRVPIYCAVSHPTGSRPYRGLHHSCRRHLVLSKVCMSHASPADLPCGNPGWPTATPIGPTSAAPQQLPADTVVASKLVLPRTSASFDGTDPRGSQSLLNPHPLSPLFHLCTTPAPCARTPMRLPSKTHLLTIS
jgi:hypothetical protein